VNSVELGVRVHQLATALTIAVIAEPLVASCGQATNSCSISVRRSVSMVAIGSGMCQAGALSCPGGFGVYLIV
jgi:hypothetical protein